ncbi:hypothetical protein NOR_00911 [Metarhizium rileyi]|uniref:GPI anchored serine-rich protein n=1 Tax=Metarhizium rileyi (strain RCEF 4871) TaxID=1649241 RepID=A0A167JLJ4_METRR|nr:hypothetical protein NOR_00911 [Metarhizium rileyi RCEF 4871]
MRFTAAAAAMMAGAAFAHETSTDYTTHLITVTACPETVTDCPARSTQIKTSVIPLTTSTVYSTKVHTITSCAPEVTKCPAHSTVISTETIAVSTTVCPVGPTSVPGHWNATIVPPPASSHVVPPPASGPATQVPPPVVTKTPVTNVPACPQHSVTAITKSYTTVLTSVEYSTIEVPCPTVPAPIGTGNPPTATNVPVNPPAGGNSTTPGGNPPPVTAGAASFAGSAVFAAVAGIAAIVLA